MDLPESEIRLVDPVTDRAYATAIGPAVLLSSGRRAWRTPLIFEVHRMPPQEYAEHLTVGHQLMLNLGGSVRLGWREGDRRCESTLTTGGLCIQSDGDANAPRWSGELTFATASIPASLVTTLLGDRAATGGEMFPKRHCIDDPIAHAYVRSLTSELCSPTEPLYSETLSYAFVLHLLGLHGHSGGRKQLAPRGKLQAAQLRQVVEFAHERLASDLTVQTMARVAGYSPFQFARLFKATTGLAPYRFVLLLRLERAARLLRDGTAISEVALRTGFYDQAHFSNMFRNEFGVTPARFAGA
jgi:AraC family transcriptional regulator